MSLLISAIQLWETLRGKYQTRENTFFLIGGMILLKAAIYLGLYLSLYYGGDVINPLGVLLILIMISLGIGFVFFIIGFLIHRKKKRAMNLDRWIDKLKDLPAGDLNLAEYTKRHHKALEAGAVVLGLFILIRHLKQVRKVMSKI